MNTQITDAQLDIRLAELSRDINPQRDIWPDIDNQLPATRRPQRPYRGYLAMAASLTLAVSLAWLLPDSGLDEPAGVSVPALAYLAPEVNALRQVQIESLGRFPADLSDTAISPGLAAGLEENQAVIAALQMVLQDDQIVAQQGAFLLDQLAAAQRRQLRLMRRSLATV